MFKLKSRKTICEVSLHQPHYRLGKIYYKYMTFENLKIIPRILDAVKQGGYTIPTDIQKQAIPVALRGGDIIGCAQTGTGKTAAFAIPILQTLEQAQGQSQGRKSIRALILTPTRELAVQIGEKFFAYGKYTRIKHAVIYGGVNEKFQTRALQSGVDILVATPGRLLDLMDRRYVHLDRVQIMVLDEADRMLDMGFIHDVKKIIAKVPQKRQTLLFSATMPTEIVKLSNTILINPVKVEVTPERPTADTVRQELYYVDKANKKQLLIHVLQEKNISSALVFTRTKHGADKVAYFIKAAGIRAEAIHGNKSQNARQNALKNFKAKHIKVLVATDIASRGIDIYDLSHVINFEIPNEPETYIHRIGRTGRAGASGIALSFCDIEEKGHIKNIQKLIHGEIPVVHEHPFPMQATSPREKEKSFAKARFGNNKRWTERRRRGR